MAYNEISDARVQNGAIANSALFFDLRDNPKGIAAGDPGAPRVVQGALALPGAGTVLLTAYSAGLSASTGANEGSALTAGAGYQLVPFSTTGTATDSFIVQRDGTLTMRIGLNRSSGSNPAYARVYRNGVAYGAIQTVTTSGLQYFTENLDFVVGDEIQLYGDRNSNASVFFALGILGGYVDGGAVRFGS